MYLMLKGLLDSPGEKRGKRGELKYEGKSHDIYENKGRANGQIGKSHDV
jgi:hypothetical protein